MLSKIRVVYNDNCRFILDLVENLEIEVETYNLDHYKQKKSGYLILARNGTKNTPLVALVNDKGEEYKIIWSENNPDWKKEINNLTENGNILH